MRAAVTGGTGSIGSHLYDRLLSSCLSDGPLMVYGAGTALAARVLPAGAHP